MIKKPSVAILYFCSASYFRYWKEFYISSQKYFLNDYEKHYFVWTDGEVESLPDVTYIYQESLGWPKHTLYRFRMFIAIEESLKKYDYIVFFNANTRFVDQVSDGDFLPGQNQNYMALEHFSYYKKPKETYPYDRNPDSRAYIPWEKGQTYFLGSLNGGTSYAYLELCKTCDSWISEDESKNILPKWFDESILNKYLLDRIDVRVLDISYGYPEALWIPAFRPKIVSISKEIFLGSKDKLRKGGIQKVHIGRWLYLKVIMGWKHIYYLIF